MSAVSGKAQEDWIEPIGQKLKRAHRLVFSAHDSDQIDGDSLLWEARETVASLVEALKPFALKQVEDRWHDDIPTADLFTLGDIRRAKAALRAAGVVLS